MAKPRRYFEGMVKVLKEAKRPMSVKELTREMIDRGLIKPTGKTPENTVYSIINQYNKQGTEPLFEKVSKGVYKPKE